MSLPKFKQIVDEAKSQIQEIGPQDLQRMRQSGEDFTLIDVREPDEHAKGAIAGAVPMPRGILERDIDKITTDKGRKIVLYCAGGFRSALAALSLKSMGFSNVVSLSGGYREWSQSYSG
jgi:rhodanese-related sulfurtransferase